MKKILLISIILVLGRLEARDIFSECFPNSPNLPVGWTLQTDTPSAWNVSLTAYAGGTTGELMLVYDPHYLGVQRCITPAFNTSIAHDLSLSFKHALSDWNATSVDYTLKVEISYDLSSWTTLQSWLVNADIPPSIVNIDIPYETGREATTYISFTFEGNNNDINYWCIDDILVSNNNSFGKGIWEPGIYDIAGNLTVLQEDTFQLQPGTELRFSSSNSMVINGRLLAQGSEAQPVIFTESNPGSGWHGISIEPQLFPDSTLIIYSEIRESNSSGLTINSSSRVRCQNCLFYGNSAIYSGGGVCCLTTAVKIIDCEFSHNNAPDVGGGIYSNGSGVIIQNCDFNYNMADSGAALFCLLNNSTIAGNVFRYNYGSLTIVTMSQANLDGFHDNQFYQNSGGTYASALNTFACSGVARRLIIHNNTISGINHHSSNASYAHATILNGTNPSKVGIIATQTLVLVNSIIYGYSYGIVNNSPTETLELKYSCIQNGMAGIGSNGILSENYISCISADPQFKDSNSSDFSLFFTSPCIDSGDPVSALDADGSRADMGCFPCVYITNPVLFEARDVTPDQGHRLHLAWARTNSDATYNPLGHYSVWRQAQTRGVDAIIVNDPLQVASMSPNTGQQVCWRDGSRYWDYITQVPALTQSVYGLVVETLADSSASGLHEAEYRVIYANQLYFWSSDPLSGYSVDNIPPNPARGLELIPIAPNQLLLSWEEVTEGSWEGNSYPELNLISYKVYADINPDFEPGPQNHLGTTTNPQALINNNGYDKRFFRVICSDSQ